MQIFSERNVLGMARPNSSQMDPAIERSTERRTLNRRS